MRRLQRVRIMNVHLGKLPVGEWRDLDAAELRGLLPGQNLAPPEHPAPSPDSAPEASARPQEPAPSPRVDPWANARKRR